MRLRLAIAFLFVCSLSACELVAKFDRDKIPLPDLKRPDASFGVKPVEDDELDAGADAAVDAATEAGMSDAEVDGATPPDDAGTDGSI